MPVPAPSPSFHAIWPELSKEQIDATRTSSWLETFQEITPKASIIDLDSTGERKAFLHWLDADSIFLPQDSQQTSLYRPCISVEEVDEDSDGEEAPIYRLHTLNDALRKAITARGGAVYPKINWSAPKDAAFILPQTAHGPLYCTSPADVHLLIKSSDFISHGLDVRRAYASGQDERERGREGELSREGLKIEMVLKEYIDIVPSREMRCFVRNNALIGICQRDDNYYEHFKNQKTRTTICDTIRSFWEDEIRDQHPALGPDYIFDVHLTPKLDDAIILDFNPYRPTTDSLLFSYTELHYILTQSLQPPSEDETEDRPRLPVFKTIDGPGHPEASRAVPAYGENMMPIEMIEMSQGRSLQEFTEAWQDAVARGMSE